MYKINDNYQKLPGSYLFSNIAKKVAAFSEQNPDADIIRLGIGDVTQPIAPAMIEAMHKAVDEMADAKEKRLQKRITRPEAVTLTLAKFLSQTVQRVIPEIFRRFLPRTTELQCVIRYILFMWIPMLWLEEPVYIMRKHRCGAM